MKTKHSIINTLPLYSKLIIKLLYQLSPILKVFFQQTPKVGGVEPIVPLFRIYS